MTDFVCTTNPAENQEVWKDIPGYPGYQVSDFGNVRSFWKKGNHAYNKLLYEPKKQRQFIKNRSKRSYVSLKTTQGKSVDRQTHTLVLMAFVGARPVNMEACHNDGNYLNNHISNLRWDTRLSNCQDRIKHGQYHQGE